MIRRVSIALLAVVLCVGAATTALAKTPKRSTSVEVQRSAIQKGKKKVEVTGKLSSRLFRCQRQRRMLLFVSGPGGTVTGPAIGSATSSGGSADGEFTIRGKASEKITPTTEFLVVAQKRRVKVKRTEYLCRRGVSASFPGDFS